MFVKIDGITTAEDALSAVEAGADAVGFIFTPSVRQLPPTRAAEIIGRLPPEVLTVGVFRNDPPAEVLRVAREVGVRAVQLHGEETPAQTQEVSRGVGRVIKALADGPGGLADAERFGTDLILVDGPEPGSGTAFDWSLIRDVPPGLNLILAGGLHPDNVAAAIEQVRPWGVDVSSGVEREPGRKDPEAVRRFVEAAKAAAG